MSTHFRNGTIHLNNIKLNWLDRHLPDVLLVFFVLQQFGFSYHLSFGSVGLALMAYLMRNDLSVARLKIPFLLTPLILLSYFWVLVRYGYDERILSIFPTLISTFFLFATLRYEDGIKLPSANLLVGLAAFICSVAWYQLFVDRSFQVPEIYFAMGSNISFAEDLNIYDFYKYVLRTNSIYSEPSYFGMVLCCFYVLIFYSKTKLKFPAVLMIIVTQLMAGSGLGIVGTLLLTYIFFSKFSFRQTLSYVIGMLIIVFCAFYWFGSSLINYDWAIVERVFALAQGDDSTSVRLIYPFLLIAENFANFDWLGIPSNFYNHFLYTNLYDSMGGFPGHNGILGLLIQFGLIGLLILALLAKQLRTPLEWVLLIIIGSQNGGLLTYEKVFSLIFVVLALRSASFRQTPLAIATLKFQS